MIINLYFEVAWAYNSVYCGFMLYQLISPESFSFFCSIFSAVEVSFICNVITMFCGSATSANSVHFIVIMC